jgi:hypothetical protein
LDDVASVLALELTLTATAPAVPAGVVAMRVVSSTCTTEVAATPLKDTPTVGVGVAAGSPKPVPVIVTEVPPSVDPEEGLRLTILGRATHAPP